MHAATPAGTPTGDPPFASDALRTLAQALEEAARLGHEYVGAEHLVLAMTRPPTSPAAAILESRGVDPDRVYRALAGVLSPGPVTHAADRAAERPHTSRAKRALALAADSARELGHARVRSVHVLVGIMREGENGGAQVLGRHGFTAEAAQEGTRLLVANGDAP